jgi:DNA-directed RNA polymerase specialized sigma24 family protein
VIFVLDIENCLKKLGHVDQAILSRVVLQEYTHEETAAMLGVSLRSISYKYKRAVDNLTELLLHAGLLILPPS